MAKIMVFQHVPYEPLGTLDPLIRAKRHRIRYVNFGRNPTFEPNLNGYDGLIILGGPMNVGDDQNYPHLLTEQEVIRNAMKRDIPVLGICLGVQLIAAANGAHVYPAGFDEIGWTEVTPTQNTLTDPVFSGFMKPELIFQWHSYTFDLPDNAELLLRGNDCKNQAICLQEKVYGLQFHLESNTALINRWLNLNDHQSYLGENDVARSERIALIEKQTKQQIINSVNLSEKVFSEFLELFPSVRGHGVFPHR